jgi:alkylated DNA repair protein (DNA oxidative demethylase)
MADLLDALAPRRETIRPGMAKLRGLADPAVLLPLVHAIAAAAPFRNMVTPGGHTMSVAMTNAGALGWVTDQTGYRYDPIDPLTGTPWPALPEAFLRLAARAAETAGFGDFVPDACLVNRYAPGTRLTAHQDRNGETRAGTARAVSLASGDVVVWGGPARLAYHGVRDLKDGTEPLAGSFRYNLTMRRAGGM